MNRQTIRTENLYQEIQKDPEIKLIDVRTSGEYGSEHIQGSKNLPLGSKELSSFIESNKNSKVYIICQSGKRASMACENLSKLSENLVLVEGGVNAWKEKQFEISKGKGVISIERQVRIICGFLILSGIILSQSINPSFIFLSAFVGIGLAFSGITDTCAMGILLTKMPWNNNLKADCHKGCAN